MITDAMAHNDEAGGSGGDALRSLQLTYDEANVLYWQRIPVSVQYKLSHGCHISNAGFAVPPPPPAGPELCALITKQKKHMTPADRNLPSNEFNSPAWPRRFKEEHAIELARAACRANGHFNNVSRHAWWLRRDVDTTLQQHGYRLRVL